MNKFRGAEVSLVNCELDSSYSRGSSSKPFLPLVVQQSKSWAVSHSDLTRSFRSQKWECERICAKCLGT